MDARDVLRKGVLTRPVKMILERLGTAFPARVERVENWYDWSVEKVEN